MLNLNGESIELKLHYLNKLGFLNSNFTIDSVNKYLVNYASRKIAFWVMGGEHTITNLIFFCYLYCMYCRDTV